MKPTLALNALIDKAYRTIEQQPEYLLEHDGGPQFETADIIVARLIGLDDEIVDQVFLDRPLPVWRMPAAQAPTFVLDDGPVYEPLKVVEFQLQSNYATAWLDAIHAPPGTAGPPTFRAKVLCLRYRREPMFQPSR